MSAMKICSAGKLRLSQSQPRKSNAKFRLSLVLSNIIHILYFHIFPYYPYIICIIIPSTTWGLDLSSIFLGEISFARILVGVNDGKRTSNDLDCGFEGVP